MFSTTSFKILAKAFGSGNDSDYVSLNLNTTQEEQLNEDQSPGQNQSENPVSSIDETKQNSRETRKSTSKSPSPSVSETEENKVASENGSTTDAGYNSANIEMDIETDEDDQDHDYVSAEEVAENQNQDKNSVRDDNISPVSNSPLILMDNQSLLEPSTSTSPPEPELRRSSREKKITNKFSAGEPKKNKIQVSKKISKPAKKQKLYRPPVAALDTIRGYHSASTSQGKAIPLLYFQRLVCEITRRVTGSTEIRYQGAAIMALHEVAEEYCIGLFEDSYLITSHCKRVTIRPEDIRLALRIRGGR